MKRLSEYKDEEALDLLADILSPTVEIMQDEAVQKFFNKGDENMTVADVVTLVIKTHKKAVIDKFKMEASPIKILVNLQYACRDISWQNAIRILGSKITE